MADLSEIKPSTFMLEIKHPGTGRNIGLSILLSPPDDPSVKNVARNVTDEALFARTRGKSVTTVDMETAKMRLSVAAAIGWEWSDDDAGEPASFNGERPEFSKSAVKTIFVKVPFILDQVDEALSATKNFFPTSP